ncbi:MAG: SWIM zinc finger family protein [Patescibacteria group bacterium]
MPPRYNFEKIKFATDRGIFERAVKIYDSNGVKNFEDTGFGFTAKVQGSGGNLYKVSISNSSYDEGSCGCYLGQNNYLCKHMVAAAIHACLDGKVISKEEKELFNGPVCSGKLGEFKKNELAETKNFITAALKYVKPYNGPSRIWFAYQNSLSEGCARLSAMVSKWPISEQTAGLLVGLLLRLDKKLCTGGVDDSDGTVGGFMEEAVVMLQEYTKLDPSCVKAFKKFCGRSTCFGWEEPLIKIFDERRSS